MALPVLPAPRRTQRSRGWCFTLNNHTQLEIDHLLACMEQSGATGYVWCLSVSAVLTGPSRDPFFRYVMQEERGETGTPHIQGFVYFRNQIAVTSLKQWNNRLHLEATRSVNNSVDYCSDPEKRHGRIWAQAFRVRDELHLLEHADLYDWQRELLEELTGRTNDRSIVWYTDPNGGTGKTQLCKHVLGTLPGVCYLTGAAGKDIAHQIVKARCDPRIVLCNFARSSEGNTSYAALEAAKDGLVFSGKYEGGVRMFPSPHVIVFANWSPDITQLSLDRWKIRRLEPNPPRRLYELDRNFE